MTDLPKVTHYGAVKFGDLSMEAVVLEDGTRGFVQRQLAEILGLAEYRGNRFAKFLGEFAPNAMKLIKKSDVPRLAQMPHGGKATFTPCEVIPELASEVIQAALDGRLHPKRRHLIPKCMAIQRALSSVGLVALIDEATGYQYHREPDALQDLFAKLIRETALDWERRFHPEYYRSLFKLFRWTYKGHGGGIPNIIGKITLQWVYEPVFPIEIMEEIRRRQHSERLHQWLTEDGGLKALERQRDAVMMMAQSSADFKDFETRCSNVFYRHGQQIGMLLSAH